MAIQNQFSKPLTSLLLLVENMTLGTADATGEVAMQRAQPLNIGNAPFFAELFLFAYM